ncbi:MAG: putative rane protein, partial [Paenibacillus sp.]|nr:putative rane protein [Paenibacillus sp.]
NLAQAFNQMIGDIRQLITRLRTEERQKEANRFQMLMSQMNPHFLLNTLNTIKWNARNHADSGTFEICQNLGKLLECSLNVDVDLVHLKEEIDLVKAYVHIQSFRYDHSFAAEYEIGELLEYALVPKLSLQPLVENAIYHGLVHMKAGGTIKIRVSRHGEMLRLEVQDNGLGPGPKKPAVARKRKGIGLDNLKERLTLLYKGEAEFQLISLEQGTQARMDIPLLISSPYYKGDHHVEDTAGRG